VIGVGVEETDRRAEMLDDLIDQFPHPRVPARVGDWYWRIDVSAASSAGWLAVWIWRQNTGPI
jgi:hypothetical protein